MCKKYVCEYFAMRFITDDVSFAVSNDSREFVNYKTQLHASQPSAWICLIHWSRNVVALVTFCHWLHRNVSKCRIPVQPVSKNFDNITFPFSVRYYPIHRRVDESRITWSSRATRKHHTLKKWGKITQRHDRIHCILLYTSITRVLGPTCIWQSFQPKAVRVS